MFSTVLEAYRSLTDDYYEEKCIELEAEFLAMMHKMMRGKIKKHPEQAVVFAQMAAAMMQQRAGHRLMREKQREVEEGPLDDLSPHPPHLITPEPDTVGDL